MSDVLAIFGPTDIDSRLVSEIERLHPLRVTVLLEGVDPDWAGSDDPAGQALRDRLAALVTLIERRTDATVTGLAGDRAQLTGWRFDREVSGRAPARREGAGDAPAAPVAAVACRGDEHRGRRRHRHHPRRGRPQRA